MGLLDALIDGGVDPKCLMPGTGLCALSDTVSVTRHAVERGCGGVMMLPPFYYKAVSDDGLFAYYSDVIERIGDDRLKIYLYHIPPVAQVGLSVELVGRLIEAYPDTVVGLKDSSGDWDNTTDIATWPWISRFEWHTVDMNEFPNVVRWYKAIAARPAVEKGYHIPIRQPDGIPLP